MAELKIFSEEQKQINRNTAFKIISKAKTELEQKLEERLKALEEKQSKGSFSKSKNN